MNQEFEPNGASAPEKTPSLSRRTVLGTAAWAAPAIALSVASPAHAASQTPTVTFVTVPPAVAPGATYGVVVIAATTNGLTPAPAGSIIVVTLTNAHFADGSTTKGFPATGALESVTISGIVADADSTATSNPIVATYLSANASGVLEVLVAPVMQTGNVFGWGYNAEGQNGNGKGDALRPKPWNTSEVFQAIYGGWSAFGAVTPAGTVFLTGNNGNECFGDTSPAASSTAGRPYGPALNETRTAPFTMASHVVATHGPYDSGMWIMGKDGQLYTAGENSGDQYSLGDGTKPGDTDNPKGGFKPAGLEILKKNPGRKIVYAASAGWFHAAYLLDDGTAWFSGANRFHTFGNNGVLNAQYLAAQPVKSDGTPLVNIKQVRPAQDATMFLDNDGKLWGAGTSTWGTLPGAVAKSKSTPVALPLTQPSGKDVINIWVNASNSESFFAQTTDGAVYSVGRNINGSSGVGHINEILVWTPVLVPAGKSLAKIYGGGNGNLFLMTDGTVYFAGANDTGGAGNDTKGGNISTMVQVPLPRPAFEIAATYYDSYAAILVP